MPNSTSGKIGITEVPRSWAGSGLAIQSYDLDANVVAGNISQGGIVPNQIGLPVHNATGGTLTKGTLVCVSGWNAATGRSNVVKAAGTSLAAPATWIILADLLNGADGLAGKHLTLTGQNTNAATVGDPVYLSDTAGGYALTTPPAATEYYQIVGRVAVKSATVGQIEFDLASSQTIVAERLNGIFPTIATTGTTEGIGVRVPHAGTIIGMSCSFNSAIAVNGTNYVTLSANNRTATKLLTNAVVGNSTNTGGQAITQYGLFTLTLTATAGDLVVAAGDLVTVSGVATGTLGAALNGMFSLVYTPS